MPGMPGMPGMAASHREDPRLPLQPGMPRYPGMPGSPAVQAYQSIPGMPGYTAIGVYSFLKKFTPKVSEKLMKYCKENSFPAVGHQLGRRSSLHVRLCWRDRTER